MRWTVLAALLGLLVACAPRARHDQTEPPALSDVGASPIDSWNDDQELEFGLLIAFEVLSRHGSTRYLPPAGSSADGGTEQQPDPRRAIYQRAQGAAKEQPLERYLNDVLDRVASQGARHERALPHRGRSRDFTILVVETDEAYSCAAPGRLVFVTTGLLEALHSEAELAFILATEVAHVDREHALDVARLQLHASGNRSSDVLGNPKIADGMAQAVMKALFETGLGTTRDFEADRLAVLYMTGADYDSTGPTEALQRLEELQAEPIAGRVLRQTHPGASERVANLKDTLERLEPPYLDGDVGEESYATSVLQSQTVIGPELEDEPPDFDAPPEDMDDPFRKAMDEQSGDSSGDSDSGGDNEAPVEP